MKNPLIIQNALKLVLESNKPGNKFEVIGELKGKPTTVISVLEENGVVSFAAKLPQPKNGVTAKYYHSNEWENIRREKPAVGGMNPHVFDAVALLHVYFFEDLAYPGVKTQSERDLLFNTIRKAGYMSTVGSVENASNEVHDLYNKTLEEHVSHTFPDDWEPTHDYWGAKCIAYKPGWNAPKSGTYFAGDSSCKYQAFDSSEALWETTNEILEEIESKKEQEESLEYADCDD